MATAICSADQSAHCSSPVITSSSTQESTSVAGRIAAGPIDAMSLATEQCHDLVGTQAGHVPAGRRVTQPPGQALAPGLRRLVAHNLQGTPYLDDLDLIAGMQAILNPQMRRDGHLALAVQHHDSLPRVWTIVLLLPCNTTTP